MLLGIDVGTTHCKVGLFTEAGAACQLASCATPVQQHADGHAFYDPEQLWQTVLSVIKEVTAVAKSPIAAIGIASMAETGLLIDRRTGQPRSNLIPWFDQAAATQAKVMADSADSQTQFCTFGIYPSFKNSLAKILWLQTQDVSITANAVWLHAADYIAYRLTGAVATDYTLAGRTYAFDLFNKRWDAAWLTQFGLTADIFPEPQPSGTPIGQGVHADLADIGLAAGTPVAICGHDHLCAAFAAGAVTEGMVFNSLGTAETLLGALDDQALTIPHYQSGLTFGHHTSRNQMYWLGGSSAAGGSIEWLRTILGDPPLTYQEIEQLAMQMTHEPGDLIYLPYLSGRSAPWPDSDMRGAFIGLSAHHQRGDLLKAVLEGLAYQIEAIRRAAGEHLGQSINQIVVSGGGVRNQAWLQIKADVCGCQLAILPTVEATLMGAALLAGLGNGMFKDEQEALAETATNSTVSILPSQQRHQTYQQRYQQSFLPLQAPLQHFFQTNPLTPHRPSPTQRILREASGEEARSHSVKGTGARVSHTTMKPKNLLTLKQALTIAEKGGYALGSFSPRYTAMIRPVLQAGERARSPLIVQISANELRRYDISPAEFTNEFFAQMTALDITVPVVLHLDHTKTMDVIKAAIAAGFTSVMIDASEKPLAENIAISREAVAYAHEHGVSAEAELGRIGTTDFVETDDDTELYTRPDEAERFVRETQTDALAVSVGTAHGVYTVRQPKVDLKRLQAIRQRTSAHMVLHGGSGVPAAMVIDAIQLSGGGVSKVNIATDLEVAALAALGRESRLSNAEMNMQSPTQIENARNAVLAVVEDKMRHYLSSAGRADDPIWREVIN